MGNVHFSQLAIHIMYAVHTAGYSYHSCHGHLHSAAPSALSLASNTPRRFLICGHTYLLDTGSDVHCNGSSIECCRRLKVSSQEFLLSLLLLLPELLLMAQLFLSGVLLLPMVLLLLPTKLFLLSLKMLHHINQFIAFLLLE